MSIKLTDTQLITLSTAARREDRCIVMPANLKGGAARQVIAKLSAAGLVREIKAKAGMPIWRHDEEAGQSYALKLTAAGLKAIAIEQEDPEASEAKGLETHFEAEATRRSPLAASAEAVASAKAQPVLSAAAPRGGSKLATVVGLLQREGGATIDELVAATDWLPHTTRAALTGLRKRGYAIGRHKAKDEQTSAYAIADGPWA